MKLAWRVFPGSSQRYSQRKKRTELYPLLNEPLLYEPRAERLKKEQPTPGKVIECAKVDPSSGCKHVIRYSRLFISLAGIVRRPGSGSLASRI